MNDDLSCHSDLTFQLDRRDAMTMLPPDSGFLGVLMLDTRFPRPPGDIGNARTFERHAIPVRYAVVSGASPQRIVKDADPRFLAPFVEAAVQLAGQGARMITTSCGFLAAYQHALAQAVPVPVVSSSLLMCQQFAHPGIVTFDAQSLSQTILDSAQVAKSTPVQGLADGCELQRRILANDTQLDLAQAANDVVDAALQLIRRCAAVQDIVLECTNMPPYRAAVASATGRRVHDIETLIIARWNALAP